MKQLLHSFAHATLQFANAGLARGNTELARVCEGAYAFRRYAYAAIVSSRHKRGPSLRSAIVETMVYYSKFGWNMVRVRTHFIGWGLPHPTHIPSLRSQ